LRNSGQSVTAASKGAGISREAATAYEKQTPGSSGRAFREANNLMNIRDVVPEDQLRPEAKKALNDFAYFRLRYLGRYSRPWMVDAANQTVKLLESEEKEYAVVNVAPGVGKSTLFTCDIPLWLIVRNRAIRCMIGSASSTLAGRHTNRIRRELARTIPLRPSDNDRGAGAINAEATLGEEFGRFQPIDRELWRADQFVVQQAVDDGGLAELDQGLADHLAHPAAQGDQAAMLQPGHPGAVEQIAIVQSLGVGQQGLGDVQPVAQQHPHKAGGDFGEIGQAARDLQSLLRLGLAQHVDQQVGGHGALEGVDPRGWQADHIRQPLQQGAARPEGVG
jgi:hypothetical protein